MRVEDSEGRNYYFKEAAEQGWSIRTLERNINSFYYQRLLSSQKKKEVPKHNQSLENHNLEDFIMDPYIFEFLNIP
jgi:predicted nuclease of restriction endonuclease-like (RecB) superfamily